MNLTPEMLNAAKNAKTAEELMLLAKENGMEMTEESAAAYFEVTHKTGELSDEELNGVAGGWCYNDGRPVITVGEQHDCFVCKEVIPPYGHCRATRADSYMTALGWKHHCVRDEERLSNCDNCKYKTYEKGLWLCNNPANHWNA